MSPLPPSGVVEGDEEAPLSLALARGHLPDFRRLSSLHSIWQFAALVFPPSCHGVTWSASMSLMSNFFPHFTHLPFCRSYAWRFSFSENDRRFRNRSSFVRRYG